MPGAITDVTMRLPRWHGYLGLGCALLCIGVALPDATRDREGIELVAALFVVCLIAVLALLFAAYVFRTQLVLREDAVRIESLGGRQTIQWVNLAGIDDSKWGGLVLRTTSGERFSLAPHLSNVSRLFAHADVHGVPRPRGDGQTP
jgi:hypothetical protein